MTGNHNKFALHVLMCLMCAVKVVQGQAPAQTIEPGIDYSILGGVPGANAYTSFCGGFNHSCTESYQPGPRPGQMSGIRLAYFTTRQAGIYTSFGWTPTTHNAASTVLPSGVSTAAASRSLSLFNVGAFLTKDFGMVRPYGYAGAGIARDNYAWSTQEANSTGRNFSRAGRNLDKYFERRRGLAAEFVIWRAA